MCVICGGRIVEEEGERMTGKGMRELAYREEGSGRREGKE